MVHVRTLEVETTSLCVKRTQDGPLLAWTRGHIVLIDFIYVDMASAKAR